MQPLTANWGTLALIRSIVSCTATKLVYSSGSSMDGSAIAQAGVERVSAEPPSSNTEEHSGVPSQTTGPESIASAGARAIQEQIEEKRKREAERILPEWQATAIFMSCWLFALMVAGGVAGVIILLDEEKSSWLAQTTFGKLYMSAVMWNPMVAAMLLNGGLIGLLFTIVELNRNDAAKAAAEKKRRIAEADFIINTTNEYMSRVAAGDPELLEELKAEQEATETEENAETKKDQ